MQQELCPPRGSVIDLALLLEQHLQREEEEWCSGDQVMDISRLKGRLRESFSDLDGTLSGIRLQGIAVTLTRRQKEEVMEGTLKLAETCLHILLATELLEGAEEAGAPKS